MASNRDVVSADHIQILAHELATRIGLDILRFCRKANGKRSILSQSRNGRHDIGIFHHLNGQCVVITALFYLLFGHGLWAVVGYRGARDKDLV
ncbi:Uncharacterised protein [Vibrio cholerae]|nr:Uncharacterised protein [Vibrio cholerae]